MGGKGASAIDYGREHVDGGKAGDPITERQVNAGKELARCRVLLGVRLYGLVSAVCGYPGQGAWPQRRGNQPSIAAQ